MDALLIGFKWPFNDIKTVWSYNVLIFFCPCSNLQRWRFIFHFMFSMKLAGSKANGSWWLVSHSYGCSCALRMWVPGNSMLRESKVGMGDFCGLISTLACQGEAAAVANHLPCWLLDQRTCSGKSFPQVSTMKVFYSWCFILLVVLSSFNEFYTLWDQQHQPYSYFDSEHTANIGSGFHCTENSLGQQLLFNRLICNLGKEELPVITIFYFSAQLWEFMDISTALPPADSGSDTDLSLPNMTVVCLTWFCEVHAMNLDASAIFLSSWPPADYRTQLQVKLSYSF